MSYLYTKMKVFHFKEKIDSLPRDIDRTLPPIHIRIKPTNVCNHNCGYCAYRVDNLQLGKDMVTKNQIPREKMLEIINDIVEMGVKAITFSGGGEPFVYPHLLEVVKKLSDSPVKFASLTNGSRLKGDIAEAFAHNATWLRISIDGWDNESYSEYRRVSESEFDKVMKNIEDFSKLAGQCYLGVSIIADRKNARHIFGLASRLKDLGAHSVKISPCIVSNEGSENNDYHMPIFDSVKSEIRRAVEELADDDFEVFDSYHGQLESFEKHYTWCPYQQILPVIGADMVIYPCQDKAYNLAEGRLGSIENQRFRDFWFSDKNNFFRINPSVLCNHHCVADSKNKLLLEYLRADREHLAFV